MQFIQTAAYDPIFWLHHSYVDKVWAERQDNQDLQPMTKSELEDIVLRPFEGKYNLYADIQYPNYYKKYAYALAHKI